jgi:hypothetical protein
VVDAPIRSVFMRAFERHGAVPRANEVQLSMSTLLDDDVTTIRSDLVGQAAASLLEHAGITREDLRCVATYSPTTAPDPPPHPCGAESGRRQGSPSTPWCRNGGAIRSTAAESGTLIGLSRSVRHTCSSVEMCRGSL